MKAAAVLIQQSSMHIFNSPYLYLIQIYSISLKSDFFKYITNLKRLFMLSDTNYIRQIAIHLVTAIFVSTVIT